MKIIYKDKWGFWFLARYTFILEDEEESLTELVVSKEQWLKFNVGDFYDTHYKQLFKYDCLNED